MNPNNKVTRPTIPVSWYVADFNLATSHQKIKSSKAANRANHAGIANNDRAEDNDHQNHR